MNIIEEIREKLFKGNIKEVKELAQKALDEGLSVKAILNDGLIRGMDVVGQKFKKNEIFVPEVLLSAKAMHAGLSVLEHLLVKEDIKPAGKVLIGTVKGDLHDIGKNLVSMMLKGAGFEVVDYGIDVSAEKFIEGLSDGEVDILAMSSLLTTSMPFMKVTIEEIKKRGLSHVKVMVGGAPVSQEFADKIGADGYAPDASSAVDKAKELLRK